MEERIICSAIWFKEHQPRAVNRPINTPGGVVLCGYRHVDIISQLVSPTGKKMYEMGESVQGFLTNRNRFLDRESAGSLFKETGGELKHHHSRLFSEDLY